MQQIEPGIYYEDAYHGVTLGALIFNHGTVMIDAPLRPDDARSWRAALINMGGSTNRILINLDAHPDRTLGARALDCPIVAHEKTAQVFHDRPTIFKGQTSESGAEWEINNEMVGTRWSPPDITFSDSMYFHWGKPEVILEHHPGPTQGSVWAIIPEGKVVFVGDTIIADQPPFLAQSDLHAWIESLDVLLSTYREFLIISARSGPVGSDEVRTQQRYLKKIVQGLERLAKRNAFPEMTEGLIANLLKDFSLTNMQRERYAQRLRYGLYHYYTHHYHPIEETNPEE